MAEWTNDTPYENSPEISYNEPGVTYDDIKYTYNGKLKTIWTNEEKSS